MWAPCLGACWNSWPHIYGPRQAQKGQRLVFFSFSFFLKEKKKKTERQRENGDGFCSPQLSGGKLLSILGLWVCDSCELPSVGVIISLKDS